tara:strand:+ start:3685 stop:4962 length:1278 start_codon:yes stop_codon:yes gene_type:complete
MLSPCSFRNLEKKLLMKLLLFLWVIITAIPILCQAEDWPNWRGSDRTGRSLETGLLQSWPSGGPIKAWTSMEAGMGYSGFSVVQGGLYTMGAFGKEEKLLAFNATTGKKIWSLPVGELLTNGWGDGPRMTPSVTDGKVYALGGRGNLVCADARSGKKIWQVSLVDDLGGKVPNWGYTESILVDQGRVICTPGGSKGAIAALDAETGKLIWQSKQFTDAAQYSSPIMISNRGKREYVQLVMQNLVGISANTGNLSWKSSWTGRTAVIPTPVFDDGCVFISSGYGVGCKLVKLSSSGARDVYDNKSMKNHHGGVIKVKDHLYGYSDQVGWACIEFNSGDLIWNDKKSLGKGAIAYADNRFYCQGESDGRIILIEATPQGWKPQGEFTLSPQSKNRNPRGKIWTHPVISNGKMYLRDQEIIICHDIKI